MPEASADDVNRTPPPADDRAASPSPEHDVNRPAPGELALVQLLINTADLEDGIDRIADPESLGGWLSEHGLAAHGDEFGPDDVRRLIDFREALRHLLLSHNGGAIDAAAVEKLDEAARAAQVVVGFAADGEPRLSPARGGLDGAIGRLLAIIARAEAEGTWARLKTCPADDCMWAFYDFSRNQSRTWCDMSVCGNRAKARAYRRRSAQRRGERERRGSA